MAAASGQTRPTARYIAIEGIDGSGKSTLIKGLAAELAKRGMQVVTTEEPTRGAHGREIRARLGDKSRTLSGEEWLTLFEADRREHMDNTVRPALAAGKWVLSDRSFYSTAAYQGAQGVDVDEILRRNRAFAVEPDLVVILDLDPVESVRRIREKRRMETDAFERTEFLARVRAIYRSFTDGGAGAGSARSPSGRAPRFVHLDASKPQADLLAVVTKALQPYS